MSEKLYEALGPFVEVFLFVGGIVAFVGVRFF